MFGNIKKKIKKSLFNIKNPLLTIFIINYFSRNNIYVNKKFLFNGLLEQLKVLVGYSSFSLTGTGVLILFYKFHIIKIPLGRGSKESLKKEFLNYKKIKESEFNYFVDYIMENFNTYYKMERLLNKKITNQEINSIIASLSAYECSVPLEVFVKNKIINVKLFKEKYNINLKLPLNKLVRSSPMHGDLTKTNIMLNRKGNVVLIDLDRYNSVGISEIDLIHYNVDKESKHKGISYFKYLESLIFSIDKNNYEIFYLYLYFLYRISAENREDITLDESYQHGVCELHQLFARL
jgi:hypothetical protein